MMQKMMANLAFFIVRLMSYLPMRAIRWIGNTLGLLTYHILRERRNVGLVNLTLCFPDMSKAEKRKIIKQHFKYLITAGLEYGLVFYASKEKIKQIVSIKNGHYLNQIYERRPIILLCPHFVGLDIGAIRLSLDYVGYSIYSKQKNNYIAEQIKRGRLRFIADYGAEIFSRQEGLRPIIRVLKKTNRLFYYLPDQDFEKDSLFVPFFAHKTCSTLNALPKIVSLTNAIVVPMAVYRVGDKYEVEISQPWDNYPTDNLENDVIRMNQFIEEAVLKNIAQYFWLHKRFKTQPDGRHKLYKDC